MKIHAANTPSLVSSAELPAAGAAASSSDAAWFSAALQAPAGASDAGGNQGWINKITSLSANAGTQASQADRALAKASRSVDPQSVMEANRTLSSWYLESLMNAKLVGKGVQSLEKLTNLQ